MRGRENAPTLLQQRKADKARKLYEQCIIKLRNMGIDTYTGVFGADMKVESVGDGPVTILLDSNKRF